MEHQEFLRFSTFTHWGKYDQPYSATAMTDTFTGIWWNSTSFFKDILAAIGTYITCCHSDQCCVPTTYTLCHVSQQKHPRRWCQKMKTLWKLFIIRYVITLESYEPSRQQPAHTHTLGSSTHNTPMHLSSKLCENMGFSICTWQWWLRNFSLKHY